MTTSKIEVSIGNFSFNGEGEAAWLSEQLDKILDRAESIVRLASQVTLTSSPPVGQHHEPADFSQANDIANKTLVTFLKEKNATSNQVEKFLATAAWLEAKGQNRVSTKDVSAALKNASQKRLTNASDALAKNVSKGFCEKEGNQFFVTQEGKEHLGIA